MKLQYGQIVHVYGDVKYGDRYYGVDSDARVIVDYGNGWVQLVLADIDGDQNVTVTVRKRIIQEYNI